jgi:hypothetical protein
VEFAAVAVAVPSGDAMATWGALYGGGDVVFESTSTPIEATL